MSTRREELQAFIERQRRLAPHLGAPLAVMEALNSAGDLNQSPAFRSQALQAWAWWVASAGREFLALEGLLAAMGLEDAAGTARRGFQALLKKLRSDFDSLGRHGSPEGSQQGHASIRAILDRWIDVGAQEGLWEPEAEPRPAQQDLEPALQPEMALKGARVRTKVALAFGVMMSGCLLLLSGVILSKAREALLLELTQRARILSRNLADYTTDAVLDQNRLVLESALRDVLKNEGVVAAVVLDMSGLVLVSSNKADFKELRRIGPKQWKALGDFDLGEQKVGLHGGILYSNAPIARAGVSLGWAHVDLSQSAVERAVWSLTKNIAGMVVISLLIAVTGAVLLAIWIVSPINALTRGAQAIGRGDLNSRITVTTGDEIGLLATTFNTMTADLKAAQASVVERELFNQELGIAAEIQLGLLPASLPAIKGYESASAYEPAKQVGGDYFDVFELGPTTFGIAIADVSGKGIPGSLGMALARTALRTNASFSDSPAEVLRRTNASICADFRKGMFVTMVYATLDTATHRLRVANAGHVACLVFSNSGMREVGGVGTAVGIFSGAGFRCEEKSFQLLPGEGILLCTDGITEALDRFSNEFGEERLHKLVWSMRKRPMSEVKDVILAAVAEFAKGIDRYDDITLLMIRRLGTGEG